MQQGGYLRCGMFVVIVGRVNAELKPRRLSFLMAELSDLISLLTVIISGKREQGGRVDRERPSDRPAECRPTKRPWCMI